MDGEEMVKKESRGKISKIERSLCMILWINGEIRVSGGQAAARRGIRQKWYERTREWDKTS